MIVRLALYKKSGIPRTTETVKNSNLAWDFVGVSSCDFMDRFFFGASRAIHEITRTNTNKKLTGNPSFDAVFALRWISDSLYKAIK